MSTSGYVIELPLDVWVSVYDNLHPATRFIYMEQWKFRHFWMYAPDGAVVLFVPVGSIRELDQAQLVGFSHPHTNGTE